MSKKIILSPDPSNPWESQAVFNPCPIKHDGKYFILYRSQSETKNYQGHYLSLSTISIAESEDGVSNFINRRTFIWPEFDWELFGCEDPRITKIDNTFYIFYTAVSAFPPGYDSIKIALVTSKDLKSINSKHLITPFNAKASILFPQKINGKYTLALTVDTDKPPSRIAIAQTSNFKNFYDHDFWRQWYQNHYQQVIDLSRINTDHVEVGAPPILTEEGWFLIYSHIQMYPTPDRRLFGIEAVILDKKNPQKIIKRTAYPIIKPEPGFGKEGAVKNVIFPSGALLKKEKLIVYFGSADNFCTISQMDFSCVLGSLSSRSAFSPKKLEKSPQNPIIKPNPDSYWQSKAVFNPAAVYEQGKFYLIYRALSQDNTSTLGLAESNDGTNFETFKEPVYIPRSDFEQKKKQGELSGCEDPRITKIGDTFYMFYTAYDGINPPRVALTSIEVKDFLQKKWQWSKPKLISPPGADDKNTCLLPYKTCSQYVIFHRVHGKDIAVDYVDSLDFVDDQWLEKESSINPRERFWDNKKIGIAAPPIKIEIGWLLLYHGVSAVDDQYRVGFMILEEIEPRQVIHRSLFPILEPTDPWEMVGEVPNVVFPCGAVLVDGILYVYYGGADKVICMAKIELEKLLEEVKVF